MSLFGNRSPAPDPHPVTEAQEGIPIGRYLRQSPGDPPGAMLRIPPGVHYMLIGQTGAGKTSTVAVPALLSLIDCSVLVLDFKGTLATITARFRRSVGDAKVIDPYGLTGLESSGFDPIAHHEADSDLLVDNALSLATALIPVEGKEPFWPEGGQQVTTGMNLGEVDEAHREGRRPSFLNLHRMLCEAENYQVDESGHRRPVSGVRRHMARMCVEGPPECELFLGRMLADNQETHGIRSHAISKLAWASQRTISKSLASHDVDFRALKSKPTTVYVVCPFTRVEQNRGWLRAIVTCALQQLYEPGGLPVVLLLDEIHLLQALTPVVDAFTLGREAGVQIIAMTQSIGQLTRAFGEDAAQTILSSCGILQSFAAADIQTAEYLSKRSGDGTVVTAGFNQGDTQNPGGVGHSTGLAFSQQRRPVILPHETMSLRRGTGLIWVTGATKTIPFEAVPYWDDPVLKARADPNPYYERRGKPLCPRA